MGHLRSFLPDRAADRLRLLALARHAAAVAMAGAAARRSPAGALVGSTDPSDPRLELAHYGEPCPLARASSIGHSRAAIPGAFDDVAADPALVLTHRSRARAGPVLPLSGEQPGERARPPVVARSDRAALRPSCAGGFVARWLRRLSRAFGALSWRSRMVAVD